MGFTIAWIVKPNSKSSIHELVGILNEQQLAQYRESLKIKTAALLKTTTECPNFPEDSSSLDVSTSVTVP